MDFDPDLFAILPPHSASKLSRLLDEREATHEAVLAAGQRFRDAVDSFNWIVRHRAASEHSPGIQAAHSVYFTNAADEIDPSDRELVSAKARLDRAAAARDAAQIAWEKFGFLDRVAGWVRMWAGHGGNLFFRDLPEVRLTAGETACEAVERIREQIAAVDAEWQRIERAPLPLTQLKIQIVEQVDKIAKPGQPRFLDREAPGNPGDAETAIRPRRANTGDPLNLREVLYHVGPDGRTISHPTPFLFWLDRERIIARLHAEAEKLDFREAMDDGQRENAFSTLLRQRLALAWQEEAHIEAAATANTFIERRSDCDPRAVLQIVESARDGVLDGERTARRRAPSRNEASA